MHVRTVLLPALIALALAGCRNGSEEEMAAARAPGTAADTAATSERGQSEPPLAESRTQTSSVQTESTSGAMHGNNDQATPEQQRVGPTPPQLGLDPARPPQATEGTSGVVPVPPPGTPSEAQRVSESEARASCETLTGASKDECLRNVQRGFDASDDASQGDTRPSQGNTQQPPANSDDRSPRGAA